MATRSGNAAPFFSLISSNSILTFGYWSLYPRSPWLANRRRNFCWKDVYGPTVLWRRNLGGPSGTTSLRNIFGPTTLFMWIREFYPLLGSCRTDLRVMNRMNIRCWRKRGRRRQTIGHSGDSNWESRLSPNFPLHRQFDANSNREPLSVNFQRIMTRGLCICIFLRALFLSHLQVLTAGFWTKSRFNQNSVFN